MKTHPMQETPQTQAWLAGGLRSGLHVRRVCSELGPDSVAACTWGKHLSSRLPYPVSLGMRYEPVHLQAGTGVRVCRLFVAHSSS